VFGFARSLGQVLAIAVIPRLVTRLAPEGALPLGDEVWQGTSLAFAGLEQGAALTNVFTGEAVTLGVHDGAASLLVSQALANFPVALLIGQPQHRRTAPLPTPT
jgi:maltooligosyltrehalose synthase